jgi:hypothetical protein
MTCDTCQHFIKSIQLAENTWTREICKIGDMGWKPDEGYCDKHQHVDSWKSHQTRYLRSLIKDTEFITEDEMYI